MACFTLERKKDWQDGKILTEMPATQQSRVVQCQRQPVWAVLEQGELTSPPALPPCSPWHIQGSHSSSPHSTSLQGHTEPWPCRKEEHAWFSYFFSHEVSKPRFSAVDVLQNPLSGLTEFGLAAWGSCLLWGSCCSTALTNSCSEFSLGMQHHSSSAS